MRDPETLIGRGFAYVLLSNRDAVLQALTLHDKKYRKRWDLRVQVCGKRTKRVKKNESTSDSSKPAVGVKKRVRGGKEEEEVLQREDGNLSVQVPFPPEMLEKMVTLEKMLREKGGAPEEIAKAAERVQLLKSLLERG